MLNMTDWRRILCRPRRASSRVGDVRGTGLLILCSCLTVMGLKGGGVIQPSRPELRVIGPGDQQNPILARCLGPVTDGFPAYAHYEPFAAVNPQDPQNLVAAWMTENATNQIVVQASASFDGGATWSSPTVLPFTKCASSASTALDVATDPWVTFGPGNTAYVSAQSYEGPAGGHAGLQNIAVVVSSDGGRTWGEPRAAMAFQGPREQTDNTTITANLKRPGEAYVATTRITGRTANGTGVAEHGTGVAAMSRTLTAVRLGVASRSFHPTPPARMRTSLRFSSTRAVTRCTSSTADRGTKVISRADFVGRWDDVERAAPNRDVRGPQAQDQNATSGHSRTSVGGRRHCARCHRSRAWDDGRRLR